MKNSLLIKKQLLRNEAVIGEILDRIMLGESVLQICKDEDMPCRRTFYAWLMEDQELQMRYVHAKEMMTERLSEEILEIADDTSADTDPASAAIRIHRAKLQIDTRKWLMVHLAPKRYGDRLSLNAPATSELKKIEIEIIRPENS